MTPKQKAEELFIKFYPDWLDNGNVVKKKIAKENALICINEKINTLSACDDAIWYSNLNEFLNKVKLELLEL